MDNVVDELIAILKTINGDKIITLSSFKENQGWEYELIDDGTIGFDLNSELLFKSQLSEAIENGGVVVLRQITKIKNKGVSIKRIYGFSLENNEWTPIPSRVMELAHRIDSKSWTINDKEQNVVYSNFIVTET